MSRLAIHVDNRAKRPLFCAAGANIRSDPPEKGIADAHSAFAPEPACLPVTAYEQDAGRDRGEAGWGDDDLRVDITGLPEGYIYDHASRTIYITGRRGNDPLCDPLRVTMSLRNSAGTARASVIEYIDRENRHRIVVVSAGDLMQSAGDVAAVLAERGLAVMGSPAQLVSLLRKWVPMRDGWLATEAGWVIVPRQRGYHLPDGRVLARAGTDQMPIISLKAGAGSDHNASGNLAGWRDGVAALARGNPLLMFAISAALAGAMLDPPRAGGWWIQCLRPHEQWQDDGSLRRAKRIRLSR